MSSPAAGSQETAIVPAVPARQVILSAAALWLCYFALITVRGLVVELGEFNELLWRRAAVTLVGIAITVLAWPLLRRFDARSLGTRVMAALVIMFPAALALAFVNQLAFAPVEQRMLARITEQHAQAGDTAQHSGVRIRHDVAGNVLVDVDEAMVPPEPAPPEPDVPEPEPPEPAPQPQGKAPAAQPAPPAAPAPPAIPGDIVRNSDGSMEIRRPGLIIRRAADGSAEIRTNGMVIRTGADDEVQSIEPEAKDGNPDPDEDAAAAVPAPPAVPAAPVAAAPRAPVASPAPRRTQAAARPPAAPRPRPAATPSPAATPAPADTPAAAATAHVQTRVQVIQEKVQDEGLWRQLTDVALGRYFLLIAWAALYLALGNAAQMQAAERREGEYKRAAKAAELRSLRYQVNPHFLFNTLNSLSALVMSGRAAKAEEMIQTISNFYRHSLAGEPTADVPLADEIALQRHYLEIEAVRFPERLRVEFDVPAELEDACVPGMILQPLVENSVKYAVSATSRPVTIHISARTAGGKLVLSVSDDGPGKPEGAGGTGIGLANVRDRLRARFGDEAAIESAALPAGGYSTTLIIPVIRNDC